MGFPQSCSCPHGCEGISICPQPSSHTSSLPEGPRSPRSVRPQLCKPGTGQLLLPDSVGPCSGPDQPSWPHAHTWLSSRGQKLGWPPWRHLGPGLGEGAGVAGPDATSCPTRRGGAPWPGGTAGGCGLSTPSCAGSGGTRSVLTWLSCSAGSRLHGSPHSTAATLSGHHPLLCCSPSRTPAKHSSAGRPSASHASPLPSIPATSRLKTPASLVSRKIE